MLHLLAVLHDYSNNNNNNRLRNRTTNLVSYSTSTPLNNFSNSTSQSSSYSTSQSSSYSTSKFSPQSLRNDVRLYSVDSDGPAYNDSTRYYNNNTI